MNKILVCPDKFKGTLTAKEFCDTACRILINNEVEAIPLADGGDGTLICLEQNSSLLNRIYVDTIDALGNPISTYYLGNENTAFVELALASGMVLIPENKRNIMLSNTYGTGLLLKDCIKKKYKTIYLFAGGSATNDGGLGLASAIGFRFFDISYQEIIPIPKNFEFIHHIDSSHVIDFSQIKFILATDVTNSLLGIDGATYTYAKQKGATENEMHQLEKGLENINSIIKNIYGTDVSKLNGSGASGGIALALCGLMDSDIISASNYIFKITALKSKIKNSDIVITGEGKFDSTSFQGKLVGEVIKQCKLLNKKCIVVCGDSDIEYMEGVEIKTINKSEFQSTEEALSQLLSQLAL